MRVVSRDVSCLSHLGPYLLKGNRQVMPMEVSDDKNVTSK